MTAEDWARFEQKLDDMAERQIDHIERITKLEAIVTNGLSHNVKEILSKIETVCTKYETRLTELEKFSWFRTWMNDLRDNMMKNILKLALIGGLVYVMIRFGDALVKKVIG